MIVGAVRRGPIAAMIVASNMPSPPGAWLSVPSDSAPT